MKKLLSIITPVFLLSFFVSVSYATTYCVQSFYCSTNQWSSCNFPPGWNKMEPPYLLDKAGLTMLFQGSFARTEPLPYATCLYMASDKSTSFDIASKQYTVDTKIGGDWVKEGQKGAYICMSKHPENCPLKSN